MASYRGTLGYTEGGGRIEIKHLIVRPDGLSFEAAEITPTHGRWDCAGQATPAGADAYVAVVTGHQGTLTASHDWRIEFVLGAVDPADGTLPVAGAITAGEDCNPFQGELDPWLPGDQPD